MHYLMSLLKGGKRAVRERHRGDHARNCQASQLDSSLSLGGMAGHLWMFRVRQGQLVLS